MGLGLWFKYVFRSSYKAEQHFVFLQFLISFLWVEFGFLGPIRLFLGSIHIVQQLLFSMFPSFLTFDFYLILGSFCLLAI